MCIGGNWNGRSCHYVLAIFIGDLMHALFIEHMLFWKASEVSIVCNQVLDPKMDGLPFLANMMIVFQTKLLECYLLKGQKIIS